MGNGKGTGMTDADLAKQTPDTIDDAIRCMKDTLEVFRATNDRRAIFLDVYLMMTKAVQEAVMGCGDFAGTPVFMDAEWIRRLSGKFATRYFRSLDLGARPGNAAWRIAHKEAEKPRSPVLLDVLLGINAHINFDLAQAIVANLDDDELTDDGALRRRKFDHDQVNNLLTRSIDPIQDMLARDYEPLIAVGDRLLGGLDELLSQFGLKYYRQQVWDNALTLAAAKAELLRGDKEKGQQDMDLVVAKLEWESKHLAEEIQSFNLLWRVEGGLARVWPPFLRLRGR
jgi:hypothetical protein